MFINFFKIVKKCIRKLSKTSSVEKPSECPGEFNDHEAKIREKIKIKNIDFENMDILCTDSLKKMVSFWYLADLKALPLLPKGNHNNKEFCRVFNCHENRELLKQLDAIMIEKNSCGFKQAPPMAKLLPMRSFCVTILREGYLKMHELVAAYPSVINFILRRICPFDCQNLLLYSKCTDFGYFGMRMDIFCPVYDIWFQIIEENKEQHDQPTGIGALHRNLNLNFNLMSLIFTRDIKEQDANLSEDDTSLIRRTGVLPSGQYNLTVDMREDFNGDIIIVSALYLPQS